MKQVNKYNEAEFVYNIDFETYIHLKDDISRVLDNFVEEIESIYKNQDSNNDDYLAFMNLIKLAIVDVNLAYENRNVFIDNFIKQVDNLLIKYSLYKQKPLRYKAYELSNIIVSKIKKLIFKFFLLKNEELTCLYIERLNFYQLVVLNNKIKVIYYDYTDLDVSKMQQIFNVELVKASDETFNYYKKTLIKCETEFIGISGNSNYVDLREMYKLLNYYPTVSTIMECIKQRFLKGSEVYITLPLFLDEKVVLFNSRNHGYFNVFFEYRNYYTDFIIKLIKLAEVYKLKIIVPSSMCYEDYLWWYTNIKKTAVKLKLDERIKVGIHLDECDLQFDIEKYPKVDLVLVDLDELDYGNPLEMIDKEYFKNNLEADLRGIHQFLSFKKIDHPVISYRIKDALVVEKLLIMGFNKFIFPKCNLLEINDALSSYESRRGKYVGLNLKGKMRKKA